MNKKIRFVSIFLLLCLLLPSCGKSEPVEELDPIVGRWEGMDFYVNGISAGNNYPDLKEMATGSVVVCSENGACAMSLNDKEFSGTWETSVSTDESKLYVYVLHLDIDYQAYIKADNKLYVMEHSRKENKDIGVKYKKVDTTEK